MGQECGHRQKTELLAPGKEICYCEGVGRRTAYHLSMKKEKKKERGWNERVRQSYRKRQMERGEGGGGGLESETEGEGKRAKERREGVLWGT